MRNKIKQLMNKEEGFTLVELLAVIVILGIILAIAIPSVGGIIDRAQDDADEATQELIEDSARIYFTQRIDETSVNDTVTVSTLVEEGYVDLRDGSAPTGYVTYTEDGNGNGIYTYSSGTPSS
ncbi:type IV pilus assembly protein PilA [Alkalibacterium putridalgicola]|uniref:Type IV pilus assembly protein PilA n=1 Tax=Alkalibacterium putridalgicola TaxID=426703 RepID=A0A1H7T8E9_9LACT|nr:prepilin-type N-terminal cleavage/methylation domain-containing protein [Alkalibacterium putridalgicola]GEK89323.1 hypothetical protein APU01nite_13620 [Alkalibacterium putridalgicola]SEL80789.1 type IV pilus assembly protein PilA [Alkalibacterium putridalgicola]